MNQPRPAYVIGHITVKDEAKWAEYRSQVPTTLEPFAAELVFRGCQATVMGGQHAHTDTVVIRFPDRDSMNSWYQSDAYQSLIPLREEAAAIDLIGFDEAL